MFYLNDFLERIHVDTKVTRLLRHDIRGTAAWKRGGKDAFGCFASFQKRGPKAPYAGAEIACHFLQGPPLANGDATAMFLGLTRINANWEWDGIKLPAIQDAEIITREREILKEERNNEGVDAFDLSWIDQGQEYAERLLVNWGAGTRTWSQWPTKQNKPILELRLQSHEPPFPGFSNFTGRISEILTLPQSWQNILRSECGVYLLVTDKGEQYVGSACGENGFLGRWTNYAANGHGGNKLLRKNGYRDYSVSILEIVPRNAPEDDVLKRESLWKIKLGSRVHGFNAN